MKKPAGRGLSKIFYPNATRPFKCDTIFYNARKSPLAAARNGSGYRTSQPTTENQPAQIREKAISMRYAQSGLRLRQTMNTANPHAERGMVHLRLPCKRGGWCILKFDFGKMKQDLGKKFPEGTLQWRFFHTERVIAGWTPKFGAGRKHCQILLHLPAPTQKASKLKSGRRLRPNAFKFPQFPIISPHFPFPASYFKHRWVIYGAKKTPAFARAFIFSR